MTGIDEYNIFGRSGLAALSDLSSPAYQEIFSLLGNAQKVFLDNEEKFRSKEYKWPRNPLHTWSRVWEYPYVYYALKEHRTLVSASSSPKVVDLGSGVTFFPFAVARLGYEVICMDTDPVCGPDIKRASSVVPQKPGKVSFSLLTENHLPLMDGDTDVVYCVSVLEHIHNFENTIEEVYRILKPGGLFILTIDLDACGYLDISVDRYYKLREVLLKYFDLKKPEIAVHPMDELKCHNGPIPYFVYSTRQKWMFHLKERIKVLFGKQPFSVLPNLAVWGGIMTRKLD